METRHDLEMNGNRGRRLVRAETDSESGTQSEPSKMRAKEPRKVATRRSWVRPLITSLYQLILTGIACGWWRAWRRRSWGRWGWRGWRREWSANALATEKEKTYEEEIESHKEFPSSTFHSLLVSTVTDSDRMRMIKYTRISTKHLVLPEMKTIVSSKTLLTKYLRWHKLSPSVSNGSRFGRGRYYRSAWRRPYPSKNRRFFMRTITLKPQILIRESSVWYVKYAALHGASFGRLRFLISLNFSKRQPKNLIFTPKMTIISKPLAEF